MTEKTRQGSNTESVFDVICEICQHNHKDVQATNLCLECDVLYMCKKCTTVHASKKVTENHEVVALRSVKTKEGAVCTKHEALLKKYCQTCGEAVCKICVNVDPHADHTIEKLCKTIQKNVVTTKANLQTQKSQIKKLVQVQNELRALHAIAHKVDRRDTLIKELEDHAQKCIDQITTWKEGLKEQVKADFKVIQDIPEHLATVTEMVEKKTEPVQRAEKILNTVTDQNEQDPEYLQQLITLQHDLKAVNTDLGMINIRVGGFREELQELEACNCSFGAEEIPGLGKIDKNMNREPIKCIEIDTHTLLDDADEAFIPCIANIGKNLYAVAHPVRKGELSKAINIYDLTSTLKVTPLVTLSNHFDSLYDMSATTDNKLAVLCNGTKRHCCTVKVFDPEDGYKHVRSTDEMLLDTPMSLAVGPENQFAIHGENMEKWRVGVFPQDGVEHRYRLDERAPDKNMTWGGRFIFFPLGSNTVGVYEFIDDEICLVKNWYDWFQGNIIDISATPWDDFVLVNIFRRSRLELFRCVRSYTEGKWIGNLETICHPMRDKARVSIRDDHIIVSHGKTIKVYELKTADADTDATV